MLKDLTRLKSTLIIGVFVLSMFVAFIPNASAGFIDIEQVINVDYEVTNETAIPKSDILEINLSTNFTLTGIGANFVQNSIFSMLKDSSLTIDLALELESDWVAAAITNTPASLKVSGIDDAWKSTLSISVTDKAPAFTTGIVKINATSSALSGFLFNIVESTNVFEVPFEVGYLALISADFPKGSYFEIPPYNTTEMPINITNLGNGDTNVNIEIIESPENWTISIPSTIKLDAFEGKKEISLEVLPDDHNFENETIKISLTPSYVSDSNLKGDSTILTFAVKNDGSYIEPKEDTFEIDTTMLAVILVVIILAIIAVIVFIKRK